MKYSKTAALIGLLSLISFSLCTFIVPVEQAQAVTYGGLGIYPNESEWDPKNELTKSWFIYRLEPGQTKEGKVDVINSTNELQEVKIYPADAGTTKDGAFASKAEDAERVDVGAWVKLAESEFTLRPNETKTINFTLTVPENAEVGDHMGSILVQRKEAAEVEGGEGEIQPGVRVVTRVGARIYLTVPGEVVRILEFPEFSWERRGDLFYFVLTLKNQGNVRIGPKGAVVIKNILGTEIGEVKIPEREVFPKDEIILPVEWEKAPFWARYGGFVAEARVTYGSGLELTKELRAITLPWYVPVILGGIILAIVLLKKKKLKKYTIKKGQIIRRIRRIRRIVTKVIASKAKVGWRKFKSLFLPILIFALLLALAGAIFYLWKQNQRLAELERIIRELETEEQQAEVKINKSEISIKVLNGGAAPGAAGRMKSTLEKEGFRVQSIGDAEHFNYSTTIRYKTGKLAEAELIRDFIRSKDSIALEDLITLEEVKAQTIDIILIVGKDISGL